MKKKYILIISVAILITFSIALLYKAKTTPASQIPDGAKLFVAHAGGLIDGYTITNCLEALNESARLGYSLIEVDILQTSDGEYVLSHDWDHMSNRVPLADDAPVVRDIFTDYKIFNKYTAVTLEALLGFLDENPGISIITDTKDKDYSPLEYIAEHYPEYRNRFIPQVYLFSDYSAIKKLGYDKIIATVYDMPYNVKSSPQEIASNAKKLGVYAITIADELVRDADYVEKLNLGKINYFVHTINSTERAQELFDMGVKGIYTDYLWQEPGNPYSEIVEHSTISERRYAERIEAINGVIARLSEDRKAMLRESLIYGINDEISINNGHAEMIYSDTVLSSFVSPLTQNVWLPFRKTAEYLDAEKLEYFAGEERGYTFKYGGSEYKIAVNNEAYEKTINGVSERIPLAEQMMTYTNAFFVSETFFEGVFGCEIIKTGDYMVLTYSNAYTAEDYAAVLDMIKPFK